MICGIVVKSGLMWFCLLAGVVALMAGQSVPAVILLLSAYVFHRSRPISCIRNHSPKE